MIVEPRLAYTSKSMAQHEVEQAERDRLPGVLRDLFGSGRIPDEYRESVKNTAGLPGEVWIECEVVDPQSGRWRTCDFRIRREQVVAVLRLCREAAAEQRSKPIAASDG